MVENTSCQLSLHLLRGASVEIGARGYVFCTEERRRQTFDEGIRSNRVVCSSGCTATHAGLLTGHSGKTSQAPLVGINGSRPKEVQEDLFYDLVKLESRRFCFPEFVVSYLN